MNLNELLIKEEKELTICFERVESGGSYQWVKKLILL